MSNRLILTVYKRFTLFWDGKRALQKTSSSPGRFSMALEVGQADAAYRGKGVLPLSRKSDQSQFSPNCINTS